MTPLPTESDDIRIYTLFGGLYYFILRTNAVTIDLIYYSAFLFTWGLLIAGTVITLALWWWHR